MTNLDFTDDVLEKILFKKIYTDTQYLSIFLNNFDKRWFEDSSLGTLSYLSLKFYEKYNNRPSQKILMALLKKYSEKNSDIKYEDAINKLIEIDSFDLGLNEDCYKKNIKAFVENRGLYYAICDNINDIEKKKSIDKCIKRFEAIQSISFDDNFGFNYFNDIDEHLSRISNPECKISTGWEGFDKVTHGGFLKSGRSLYIFMGQPGLGKSAFLSNITYNFLKQNLNVFVISLEMSEDVYGMRFDAHITNDNINTLHRNIDASRSKIMQFHEMHKSSKLFIKEYPPRSIRPSDIELYIDKLIAKGIKPDAIVVDYLNLLLPQTSTERSNSYETVLAVAERLRAMSYKYLVPVVTATQTNTEGINNENIGMQHISESRGIAHTADFIAALYQGPDDEENGIINAKILKNRLGGRVGKIINMKLNPDTLILSDISITENENNEAQTLLNNLDDISSDIAGL